MMRPTSETEHDLIGIKLDAVMLGVDTHEIAAIAHMLAHGRPALAHFDVRDMRRSIDRLKATVASMDAKMLAVERDIPAPYRPEYAREMEVVR